MNCTMPPLPSNEQVKRETRRKNNPCGRHCLKQIFVNVAVVSRIDKARS
jgi:hypothetical protein